MPYVSVIGFGLELALRALAVAVAVGIALRVLRVRTAAVRHAAWTAAMLAMLLMPALTSIVPPLPVPLAATATFAGRTAQTEFAEARGAQRAMTPTGSANAFASPARAAQSPAAPSTPTAAMPTAAMRRSSWLGPIAVAAYLAGLLIGAARLVYGWLLAVALVRHAKRGGPLSLSTPLRVFESPDVAVPMTVGVVRPVVLLPPSWRTWDAQTLSAVLAHETAHVRRRDPAITMAARLNRVLFWMHPLAWWLERTVTATAEQACDETAARAIGVPSRYAEILLAMADLARRSGRRVAWQGVGVYGGGQLRARIDRLLGDDPFTATSTQKKVAVAVACACGIALAVACRQEVAAPPLRPDPEVAQRFDAEAAATKRFEQARDMTQAQADALEQRVAANPEDFDSRQQLVTYYQASRTVAWDKKVPALRRHALWLIEHAPEHDVQAPALLPQYDPEGYAAAKKLWQGHLAKPDASAYLISRAVRFFWRADPAYAEQLILRGQTLDPESKAVAARIGPGVGGYQWPATLASLYVSSLTQAPDRSIPGTPDVFAIHVRQTLDRTTDAGLLARVGSGIVRLPPRNGDRAAYQEVRELGLAYLRRALELDPANLDAKMALVRAQLAEQATDIDREARRADETFMLAEDITEYAHKDAAKAKQQRDEAKGYADHVLAIAASHPNDPAYSAAVMTAHQVLAALALRDGDREAAVRHLQDSVKVPTSEQIQYVPPMSWMRPVNRLLQLGERERVAEFLERSASLTVVDRARLLSDAKAIRDGRMTMSYQWTMRNQQ